MKLSTADKIEILRDRPNRKLIDASKEYSKKLSVHINGNGLDEYLERISYFESEKHATARKRYARSNKDLFARLHRPVDKVYNARGGSISYDVPSEEVEKMVKVMTSNVEHGYTLRKWMEIFYRKALHYDPMGIILIEVSNNEAYPVHRSINDVYDYKLKGRELEYVILKEGKNDKGVSIYRIIDDEYDILAEWDGKNYKEIPDSRYGNHWGAVPATIISNIYDPVKGHYISPDDDVIEIADQYLREGSVLNVHKNLHMFPRFWAYAGTCHNCKGVGTISSDDGELSDCGVCNGSGKSIQTDASDVTVLPFPKNSDNPIVAPNVMGYTSPDETGVNLMIDSLRDLFNTMYYVQWGIEHMQKADGTSQDKTATEILYSEQPKVERLNYYSDSAEEIETFIIDKIGLFVSPERYKGVDVHYGRKYVIESPETIWSKYEGARSSGAPQVTLDSLLEEYYNSKYKGDSSELLKQTKLMQVEPLVHNTLIEAKGLLGEDNIDYQKKLAFKEWLGTLDAVRIMRNNITDLNADLTKYTYTKIERDNSIVTKQ